jgi:hypothetical protein
MKLESASRSPRGAAAALSLLLALSGCGLDEVQVPELSGPSTYGTGLQLSAQPDVITADGFSTSLIQATVFDQNGRPAAGRQIFMQITDEGGRTADIGNLRAPASTGVGTGVVVTTNGQGIAIAIYEAPPRTDATANQKIIVAARPVGTDAQGTLYRSVQIELRSAEPRFFPQIPGNIAPSCNFAVEAPGGYRVNQPILYQSTSVDPDGTIVRYYWDFGNGRRTDSPDGQAIYNAPGGYTVTHIVTDNGGLQTACAGALVIQ